MDERVRLTDLRVEYLTTPLGLATGRPRYSWNVAVSVDLAPEPVTVQQTGWEIDVRTAAGLPVWQSGRVMTTAPTVAAVHGGPTLAPNTAFRWRVRLWLDDSAGVSTGHSADSANDLAASPGVPTDWAESVFETALLSPSDWTARWIAPQQQPTAVERWSLADWVAGNEPHEPLAERLRPANLVRQAIVLTAPAIRARLFVSAHGIYTVTVNGTPPDDQVLAPGFDSYSHRVSAQCYDVTDHLTEGENVLGFTLADGWWAGRIGLTGSSAQWGDTTSLIWQLHLEYAGGRTEVRGSGLDDPAASAVSPWRFADLFVGESYDRRREIDGWNAPGFDAGEWMPVTSTGESTATLVPFRGEPVRRIAELTPASIRPEQAHEAEPHQSFIVDFGQVIAGRVRLSLTQCRPGQHITLEHTETLAADGTWFTNIAGINKEQCDVYTAAGRADETYEPTFTFHGFRYVRIGGLDRVPTSDEVTAIVIGSDLEPTGSLRTSDARLNRLHENVVWSQRANFLAIPTDCPQRERAGWTGDIQVFAPAAANNMAVAPFLGRWLDNLRADQFDDGTIPIFSPYSPFDRENAAGATGIGAIMHAAGWSDAIAMVPWTLFEQYGDTRVLEDNYDAIIRWIERDSHDPSTGQFGDWLAPSTMRGKPFHEAIGIAPALTGDLVRPMFRANTLSIAARMATLLGRPGAADLAARADRIRADFARQHISPDGSLPVQLQGVYVLALALDMVPIGVRPRVGEHLAALVEENDGRLDTGFLSVPYLLDTLSDIGRPDLARRVLWQPEQPSWLYEVDHGATTVWESWDAISDDGSVRPVSLNHYALGCVDDWLYRHIGGIRSTSPGYATVLIDPDVDCGVDRAETTVGTPFGPLSVEWSRRADDVTVDAVIPWGVHAQLQTPDALRQLPVGRSRHEFRFGR